MEKQHNSCEPALGHDSGNSHLQNHQNSHASPQQENKQTQDTRQDQHLHCPNPEQIKTPDSDYLSVSKAVRAFGRGDIAEAERQAIRAAAFSNWEHEDHELVIFLRQMYVDLGLVERLSIDLGRLEEFLLRVYASYNQVPFHNFHHCFMVAQMTYSIMWLGELHGVFTDLELLALLTAAICHDLDHPGLSNYYQRCAATRIAAEYSDSPLENHHIATAKRVLSEPQCDILAGSPQLRDEFEATLQALILATDMAKHGQIVADFEATIEAAGGQLDLGVRDNRSHLMRIIIKAADVSNEARPVSTADRWIDCLLREFFAEARLESETGIRPLPFMDPGKVSKAASQCQFIGSIVLPLAKYVARVLPRAEVAIVRPVETQLQFYTRLLSEKNS